MAQRLPSIEVLREKIPHGIFEDADLHLILRTMSLAARYSALSRWLKTKKVMKVRRGLYLLNDRLRPQSVSKFAVAARLYEPSYISFESALSFHGLIPESVHAVTSACIQRREKNYETPLGNFSYRHVPVSVFRLGVTSESTRGGAFLMAHPLKALFDLVYSSRKVYRSLGEIEDDLRIDLEELRSLIEQQPAGELQRLAGEYHKKNCAQLLKVLTRKEK